MGSAAYGVDGMDDGLEELGTNQNVHCVDSVGPQRLSQRLILYFEMCQRGQRKPREHCPA